MDTGYVWSTREPHPAPRTRAADYARAREVSAHAQIEAVLALRDMVTTYGAAQVKAWVEDVATWRR